MFLLGESTKKRSISCLLFFSLLKLSEKEEVKGNISSSFVKATDVKEHAYELYVNLKCFVWIVCSRVSASQECIL